MFLSTKINVFLRDLITAFSKEQTALATKKAPKKSAAKSADAVSDIAVEQLSRVETRYRERLAGIETRLTEAREQKRKIEKEIAEIRPPSGGLLEPPPASPCEAQRW